MEHVDSSDFPQYTGHCLKYGEKKLVELIALNGVVLDGKPAGIFKGNSVGRVRHDQVGVFAVHQTLHVIGFGGIAAEQAVPVDCPQVSWFYEGSLLQCSGKVEVIVLGLVRTIRKERRQLVGVKAGESQVEGLLLQRLDFDGQQVLVPSSVQSEAVDGEDVRLLLGFGHAGKHHIWKLGHALGFRGIYATMAGQDVEVIVHLDGIAVADATINEAQLVDLLRAVGLGVVCILCEFLDG